MKVKFNKYEEISEYIEHLDYKNIEQGNLPILGKGDSKRFQDIINEFESGNFNIRKFFTSNYGMIISPEVEFFNESSIFCDKWISDCSTITSEDSLTIICLYKDFVQSKLLKIIEKCKEENIKTFFLIGRDLESLTWFIAKQFISSGNKKSNAIFSYKTLGNFNNTKENWDIYDSNMLESKDIKEIISIDEWKNIVFHGHGKEDHLNLAEYTICGLNCSIKENERCAPACGHGENCFKDYTKIIHLNMIKAESIFLLSCNNFPFYDSRLYGTKYSLVLNAIDGYAKNIVASLGVQSADTPELREILCNEDFLDIGIRLHHKLDDIQPFASVVTIGLPTVNDMAQENIDTVETYRLTNLTKVILSRISAYSASMMLDKDHDISRWSNKILQDYMQLTRRGTYGSTYDEIAAFERDLINRVNPFTKRIAELMFSSQTDQLQEFDSYNIYRSKISSKSIKQGRCLCGGQETFCKYEPELPFLFNIESHYCYLCGDKTTGMVDMPEIKFTCSDINDDRLIVKYKIEITPKYKGDVFWAIQLPSYVENYAITKQKLNKLKFKNIRTEVIKGEIEFSKETPFQSYYMKLFVVQNAGISFSRSFFNLVESENIRE